MAISVVGDSTPSVAKTDSATKQRIIDHMNSSHRGSMSMFLQHYCHLPASTLPAPSTARSTGTPTLASITPTHLIILHPTSPRGEGEGEGEGEAEGEAEGKEGYQRQAQTKRYLIPLEPPMADLSETRSRMKSMHEECLRALDLSDTRLTTYIPPQRPLELTVLIVVCLIVLFFWRAANFVPGSYIYDMLALRHVPAFASFCAVVQPYAITALVLVHLAEAAWMVRSRMRRHQVPVRSWLWWQWVVSCLVEGFFSFKRLDAWVAEVEGKKNAD